MSKKATTPSFEKPEIIVVSADVETVMCDGGSIDMGHPAVYYRFDGQNKVTCKYCDREFVKK